MGIFQNSLMGAAASAIAPAVTEFSMWAWGRGDGGYLGNDATVNTCSPVQTGDLSTWTNLNYQGGWNPGAVRADGTLWMWGDNNNGQLGVGDTTVRCSPTQVGSLTDWAAVASGGQFALAVKTDGTLWSWGNNNEGQLGIGNVLKKSSPVQIGSATNWSSAAGAFVTDTATSFAIKTDGTLWAWGDDGSGHLGLGEIDGSVCYPNQVGSLTDWAFIHTTQQACAAVKTDGTLWAWGAPSSGQLGNGTDSGDISSPIQIGSLTNWSTVNGGQYQFTALKTDGTLWAWGNGGSGRLGLGNTTSYCSPNQIGSLTTWDKVNSIQECGSAIKTDGTLWTWGANTQGELGNGTRTSSSSPAQVGSETDWLGLSGYGQFMLASRSA